MAMENYLLSLFHLGEQTVKVTLTELSGQLKRLPEGEGLGTSLPSVGGMVRRMVREGLVETGPGKEVVLTPKGRRSAASMVRRHRLAERMVVDLLEVELQESHIEAHRLEHAISPELEMKIVARLGNPTTCPFGHAIPGSGYSPPKNSMSLDNADPGPELVIDRIPEDDQLLLEYLVENDFIPGETVTVIEAARARGVIAVLVNDNQVAFNYEVAAKIWVCPRGDWEDR